MGGKAELDDQIQQQISSEEAEREQASQKAAKDAALPEVDAV